MYMVTAQGGTALTTKAGTSPSQLATLTLPAPPHPSRTPHPAPNISLSLLHKYSQRVPNFEVHAAVYGHGSFPPTCITSSFPHTSLLPSHALTTAGSAYQASRCTPLCTTLALCHPRASRHRFPLLPFTLPCTYNRWQRVPSFQVHTVVYDSKWTLLAYVGYLPEVNGIVAVFRGTDSHHWANWLENLRCVGRSIVWACSPMPCLGAEQPLMARLALLSLAPRCRLW